MARPTGFGQVAYIRVVPNRYTQLGPKERQQIEVLLQAGLNPSEIAKVIGVHRSTITCELKRNVGNCEPPDKPYCPETAQQATDPRLRKKPKHRRFTDELETQARRWLPTKKHSPQLISGRWQVVVVGVFPRVPLPVDLGSLAPVTSKAKSSTITSNTAGESTSGATIQTTGAPFIT